MLQIDYIIWTQPLTSPGWTRSCGPQQTNQNCKSAARPGAAEAEECSLKCNNRFGWLCRKYQDISLAVMQHFLPLGRHITLLFYPLASLQLHAQKMVAYSNMRIVCILSYRETALVQVRSVTSKAACCVQWKSQIHLWFYFQFNICERLADWTQVSR